MKLLLHIPILNSYPCLIIEREQFLMQMIFFVRLIIFFQYRRITRNVQGWAPVARVSKSKDCLSSGRHRDTVVRVGIIASRTEANIGLQILDDGPGIAQY